MPSRRQRDTNNARTPGSESANIPAARAARVSLVFSQIDKVHARVISEEEEAEDGYSITWISLEYIVLPLSSLPKGCIYRTLSDFSTTISFFSRPCNSLSTQEPFLVKQVFEQPSSDQVSNPTLGYQEIPRPFLVIIVDA